MSQRISVRVSGSTGGGQSVLQASDLTYLGNFWMPLGGGPGGYDAYPGAINFSFGNFAARRAAVNGGALTFIIGGVAIGANGVNGPGGTEISYPGESVASPPRATYLRSWYLDRGNILGVVPSQLRINGFWIDPATGLLWQGYKDVYGGTPDPSMVVSQLNDDGTYVTSGPWRASCGAARANGWMMPVPAAYQSYVGGKTAIIGGFTGSIAATCSIGCNLHAWGPIDPATPPDSVSDTSQVSIQTTNFLDYSSANRQIRKSNNYKLCAWNVAYNSNFGATLTDPDMTFAGGTGSEGNGSIVDTANTGIWIETATKRGVLFVGQMADTIQSWADAGLYNGTVLSQSVCHNYYGINTTPLSGGTDPQYSCPHGERDFFQEATGPGAGTKALQCWIFDPLDLIPVAQGSVPPYTPLSASEFRLSSIPNADTVFNDFASVNNMINGSYYDSVTGKLFLCQQKFNDPVSPQAFVPRMHVFQVGS